MYCTHTNKEKLNKIKKKEEEKKTSDRNDKSIIKLRPRLLSLFLKEYHRILCQPTSF